MKFNKSKSLVLVAALAALYGAQAHATAFSTPIVTQDTATNLAVSWTWDTSLASAIGEYSFASTLTNWSAAAYGEKTTTGRFTTSPKYEISIAADGNPSAISFEYEAGSTANNLGIHFVNSAIIGIRTYTLSIDQNTPNTTQWDVMLTGVTAVPEPESYAMLLAGLGLMVTIARRRRKASQD